jgi:hypothetical protein
LASFEANSKEMAFPTSLEAVDVYSRKELKEDYISFDYFGLSSYRRVYFKDQRE